MLPLLAVAGGSAALSGLGSLLGMGAEKKAAKVRAANAARLLGIQKGLFDDRFALTNTLNTALSNLETRRFNEVGAKETALRGDLGNESVARFDEQAAAVGDQTAANRSIHDTLSTALRGVADRNIGLSDAELGRQRGYQATADAAGAALPGDIGSIAQAAARAASAMKRNTVANATISGPTLPGPMDSADSITRAAFDAAGTRARDEAVSRTGAANDVASYGDAVAAADRAISAFTDRTSRLKTQAATSEAALNPELAAGVLQRGQATDRATEAGGAAALRARGLIDISDRNRGGRMAAMEDAGKSDIESLATLFARLSDTTRTGIGGQISANQDYDNRLANLINGANSQTTGSNILGQVLSAVGNAGLAYSAGGALGSLFGGAGAATKVGGLKALGGKI